MHILDGFGWVDLAVAVAIPGVLAAASQVIYNLYLHPLASFPGPILHRATRFVWVYKLMRGTLPHEILPMHERYGPVVRLAPNELSFADEDAWKDIYGHRTGPQHHGHEEFPKYATFYRSKSVRPGIVHEGDRTRHALLRRQLSHGFSDRCMREQEPIIGKYVDLLMQRLRERCGGRDTKVQDSNFGDKTKQIAGDGREPMNMTEWYNWTTFDIIGDLALGEPFGCLERAKYDPWVAAISNMVRATSVLVSLKYLGLESLVSLLMKFAGSEHKEHTKQKLTRRMEIGVERPDLIEGLLRNKEDWKLDFDDLRANASTLIVGGSETTATLLAGATYLLLKNPKSLEKLTAEVRSTFHSEDEITLLSVGRLSYMLACLDEALRYYPPVPIGMPRVVPKGGASIAGNYVPEKTVVAVWQWATSHNSRLWKDPFGYHPERFLHDPEFSNDHLAASQPFSVGPRNCIGRNLAYSEMRLILARVIYNFDMQLVDENEDWMDQEIHLLWRKKPLNVYLKPVR